MKNSIKHLYLNEQMQDFIDHSILSTFFCGLQCSDISLEYIASFIDHSYFEMTKNVLAYGVTQEAANNDDLANISLLIPPDEVLQLYHEYTQPIYAQISKNICENQELAKLRDWLLPMLMNGQNLAGVAASVSRVSEKSWLKGGFLWIKSDTRRIREHHSFPFIRNSSSACSMRCLICSSVGN